MFYKRGSLTLIGDNMFFKKKTIWQRFVGLFVESKFTKLSRTINSFFMSKEEKEMKNREDHIHTWF